MRFFLQLAGLPSKKSLRKCKQKGCLGKEKKTLCKNRYCYNYDNDAMSFQ
jgi:hypothetical protein